MVILCPSSSSVVMHNFKVKAKLHVGHPKEVGTKVYINGQGHVTKMTVNSKTLLLRNQKAYDF